MFTLLSKMKFPFITTDLDLVFLDLKSFFKGFLELWFQVSIIYMDCEKFRHYFHTKKHLANEAILSITGFTRAGIN